jgi:hypothetical protein
MDNEEFRYRRLPVIDKRVQRLGLACNFGIDAAGVEWALGEGGMQYVFCSGATYQFTTLGDEQFG